MVADPTTISQSFDKLLHRPFSDTLFFFGRRCVVGNREGRKKTERNKNRKKEKET